MRSATVLLRPGQAQLDYGIEYIWNERLAPIVLPDGTLDFERQRDRRLICPLSLRFGLTERLQPFLNLPFGLAYVERSDRAQDQLASIFSVGDFSTGLNYLIRDGKGESADLIATGSVTAPTGPHPFKIAPVVASLGEGFWAASARVTAVRSFEPVVLFASVGYTHQFSRSFLGRDFEPGERIDYGFGLGFGVNDKITLSGSFLGAYQFDTYVSGARAPNTSSEPLSLRLAMTGNFLKNSIIEPFIRFGLTRDAPGVDAGVVFTRQFGSTSSKSAQ